MEWVRKDEVKPQPPATRRDSPDPYRVLFPIGIAAALAGLVPWLLFTLGWTSTWPGPAHAALLTQGFELGFITGFLLTAMPAFTHGPRCTRFELVLVTLGVGSFVVLRTLDVPGAAIAYLVTLLALAIIVGRRVRPGAAAPPEEFLLVGTGLAMGFAGALVLVLAEADLMPSTAARLGVRCISLGLLPALVLGLGGLLVPTFAGVKDPLTIFGIARPGERPRRRVFVVAVALLLVVAVNLEFAGLTSLAGGLRAVAVLASTQLAWKLWRRPRTMDRLSWALWAAGWCLVVGFTAAALVPEHRVEAWHIAFIGGYALLTLAIGSRVVISHGGYARVEERSLLSPVAIGALLLAALVRSLAPVFDPGHATAQHALAAALGTLAFASWLLAAWPRVRRTKRRMLMPTKG